MSRLPDLVRDSKLDTRFHPKYVCHRYLESGLTPQERTIAREEYWKRVKHIGGGSFGSVWLEKCIKGVRDHDLRAVKEILRSSHLNKEIDYNRELEAMAKFSHPKYVRCFVHSFGWYENANVLSIAMEYFPKGDLRQYLDRSPPLTEIEAQHIVYQLSEGLRFLHENDFAHRDLKPSNVLVRASPPEPWWVKIGDFGISKRAEDGVAASSTLKGTYAFLSPELRGFVDPSLCFTNDSQAASRAADMWSLGEITYQILTKTSAFHNMGKLLSYVQQPQSFPSSALKSKHVTDTGIALIRSLMRVEPIHRTKVEEVLTHDWTRLCRTTSSKPPSIVSLTLSEAEQNALAQSVDLIPEPSGRWSPVSNEKENSDCSSQDSLNVDIGFRGLETSSGRVANSSNPPLSKSEQESVGTEKKADQTVNDPSQKLVTTTIPMESTTLMSGKHSMFDETVRLTDDPRFPTLPLEVEKKSTKANHTNFDRSALRTPPRQRRLTTALPLLLLDAEDKSATKRVSHVHNSEVGQMTQPNDIVGKAGSRSRSEKEFKWQPSVPVVGLSHKKQLEYGENDELDQHAQMQDQLVRRQTDRLPPWYPNREIRKSFRDENLLVRISPKARPDGTEFGFDFRSPKYIARSKERMTFMPPEFWSEPNGLFTRSVLITISSRRIQSDDAWSALRSILLAARYMQNHKYFSSSGWFVVVALMVNSLDSDAQYRFAEMGLMTVWPYKDTDLLPVKYMDRTGSIKQFDNGHRFTLVIGNKPVVTRIYKARIERLWSEDADSAHIRRQMDFLVYEMLNEKTAEEFQWGFVDMQNDLGNHLGNSKTNFTYDLDKEIPAVPLESLYNQWKQDKSMDFLARSNRVINNTGQLNPMAWLIKRIMF